MCIRDRDEVKKGTRVNQIMRHTVGLYHGQSGANKWKRYLSDNMMARDSDFQKVHHIMTIAQNNEKANQVSQWLKHLDMIKYYFY